MNTAQSTEEDQFSLARAADKLEIQHRIYQYCRAVDRYDIESARSAFHPDATDDHGPYKGDVDGLFEWLHAKHATLPFSFHHIGNIFVEFTGPDDAFAETYVLCWNSISPHGADGSRGAEKQVAGRYIDHFQRRDGRWRIFRRTSFVESGNLVTQPDRADMRAGEDYSGFARARDASDPSRVLRKALGLE